MIQYGVALFLIIVITPFHQIIGQNTADIGKIRIASCQFPVSSDISANLNWITDQMIASSLKKATIVHFSECALTGYPGVDMDSMDDFNWDELHKSTDSVMALAKELGLWVVLGSIHQLNGHNKRYNSLYIINDKGEITDRYDKRFCTRGDLKFYSSGDRFVNFDLNGVNCGLLICYEVRFPELYRQYRNLDTDVIFQSFYNARMGKGAIHPIIMHITAQARAATNYFYMSLTNSSVPESWSCYFLTPDGLIQNKLEANVPGILISDVDVKKKYYDASERYRSDAINGKLNSGELLPDSQSKNRTTH